MSDSPETAHNSGPPPQYPHNLVLVTRRLILRGEDASDAACVAAIYRMRRDAESLKYTGYQPPSAPSEIQALLTTRLCKPSYFNFTAELRYPADPAQRGTPDNIIGMVGGVRTPEFGYQIDSRHWGRGYAVEAMRAIITAYWRYWPRGPPGLVGDHACHRITLDIVADHTASIAVARSLGFVKAAEEELREQVLADGSRAMVVMQVYELWRPGFERGENWEV